MKFTDINLDEELIAASRSIMEKREPIIINPEMHNMDTVQRLQMGDEPLDNTDRKVDKDGKEIQKDNKEKKHEFYEDEEVSEAQVDPKKDAFSDPKKIKKIVKALAHKK